MVSLFGSMFSCCWLESRLVPQREVTSQLENTNSPAAPLGEATRQAWEPIHLNRIFFGNLFEWWMFGCHVSFTNWVIPALLFVYPSSKYGSFTFASICHAMSVFGWLVLRGGDDSPYHHLYRRSDHQRFGGREIEGKFWLQTNSTKLMMFSGE